MKLPLKEEQGLTYDGVPMAKWRDADGNVVIMATGGHHASVTVEQLRTLVAAANRADRFKNLVQRPNTRTPSPQPGTYIVTQESLRNALVKAADSVDLTWTFGAEWWAAAICEQLEVK